MALVIRNWQAELNPIDDSGNFIVISGRSEGLFSFLLTCIGIDVTTTVHISAERIEYRASSLAGTEQRMIPLPSVSSTYYGYHKPWKQAVSSLSGMMVLLLFIAFAIADNGSGDVAAMFFVIGMLVSVGAVALYYLLNKKMALGFVENSEVISGITFKRSVIEGQSVTQDQARQVCEIIQTLIEAKINR